MRVFNFQEQNGVTTLRDSQCRIFATDYAPMSKSLRHPHRRKALYAQASRNGVLATEFNDAYAVARKDLKV